MRMLRIAKTAIAGAVLSLAASGAQAAGPSVHIESQNWSFSGVFGTFDRASAQRGFQVYREVCAACHAMNLMTYRYLEGIGLPPETIRALAAQSEKTVINDEGEEMTVQRLPSDRFASPFPNKQAARAANGGAYPVDLSLIAKARANGPNYLFALLTGYQDPPPPGVTISEGMHYNAAFPGHQIAMASPLFDDMVTFADGTPATVDQMARDVVTFLTFAAEPHMEDRKRTGLKVVAFLLILSVMLYYVKKKVWSDVDH